MLKDFSKDEFDIIIQAGQSNSEGCGVGIAEKPFTPNGDVWYLNNDFTISPARELVVGNEIVSNFSLSFAEEYIGRGRLKNGRKLLIVRAAVGGTGFSDKRWGIDDDLFLRMMEMTKTALSLNPKNRLAALLWHQGETDALNGVTHKGYVANLTTLINRVRETFDCRDLPFIAADFVSEWKNDNLQVCIPIIQAIKEVCANDGHARFFETSDLQSNNQRTGNGDTIHFCREALNILGVRYFNAYCEIVSY